MKNPLRWLRPTRSDVANDQSDLRQQKHMNAPAQKSMGIQSMFALSGMASAHWSATDYASMARRGYMQNPVAHRCIRLISQNVSALELLLYAGREELDDHSALQLLRKPAAEQGGRAFMESLVGHLLVSGNAYVEGISLDGVPRELHLLRPDRVSVDTDRNGWATGFTYATRRGKRRYAVEEDGTSPLLHLKLFHPLDDLYGMPPLQAAMMALDVHQSASTWNKALLDNSARPSGALVYAPKSGGNMSEEQFDRLKKELEEGFSGAAQAGRPLLLEGGLDWKSMGYSPRDMDFVEARNSAARDIALAFGVPPMLLGIPGDNTYANYREANRAFLRQLLLPLATRILDGFSNWLSRHYGEEFKLTYDEDRVEGLTDERERVWKRLSNADFLTDAEKRQALGFSPTPAEAT